MNKVYLSGSYSDKLVLTMKASELVTADVFITSRWLFRTEAAVKTSSEWREVGMEDLEDIESADTFILVTGAPSTGGGLFVELGYALAKGKRVVVIGELKGNPFYWLDAVERVPDWRTFMNNVLLQAAPAGEYE